MKNSRSTLAPVLIPVLASFFLGPKGLAAGSGADQLLKSVQPATPAPGTSAPTASMVMIGSGELKLRDPFAVHLFAQWQASDKMPYHVGVWAQKALTEDFRGAAHLWGQVKGSFSQAFAPTGRTASYISSGS